MYYQPPPAPPTKTGGGLLWGVCMTVLIAALGASGTLLYKSSQKAQTEVQQAVYQAVMQERSRVTECVQQTPTRKEVTPKTQLTGNDGNNNLSVP